MNGGYAKSGFLTEIRDSDTYGQIFFEASASQRARYYRDGHVQKPRDAVVKAAQVSMVTAEIRYMWHVLAQSMK